ncbi:MAG: orotidine-5'-phosphate decarboxylase [Candidatus Omnitrophica bacterium]|nr:orotidine-5'-phosphate decarboxylase [Candidatus Omnitrophota bacterium]
MTGRMSQRGGAERLIVAFDAPDLHDTLRLAKRLRRLVSYAKIGSILFTAAGPAAIARVRALGFRVFLDLKFHDIPSTVEKSCRAAAHHGISMLTVHAAGGRHMLEAAVRGVSDEAKRMKLKPAQRPKVLAVTILTSDPVPPMTGGGGSERRGGRRQLIGKAFDLVEGALAAKCDGLVASAQEVQEIRAAFPDERFVIVCPGIRPSWAFRDDQRRIATPAEAVRRGADFLVVGRPITEARDPREAVKLICQEIKQGVQCAC